MKFWPFSLFFRKKKKSLGDKCARNPAPTALVSCNGGPLQPWPTTGAPLSGWKTGPTGAPIVGSTGPSGALDLNLALAAVVYGPVIMGLARHQDAIHSDSAPSQYHGGGGSSCDSGSSSCDSGGSSCDGGANKKGAGK